MSPSLGRQHSRAPHFSSATKGPTPSACRWPPGETKRTLALASRHRAWTRARHEKPRPSMRNENHLETDFNVSRTTESQPQSSCARLGFADHRSHSQPPPSFPPRLSTAISKAAFEQRRRPTPSACRWPARASRCYSIEQKSGRTWPVGTARVLEASPARKATAKHAQRNPFRNRLERAADNRTQTSIVVRPIRLRRS